MINALLPLNDAAKYNVKINQFLARKSHYESASLYRDKKYIKKKFLLMTHKAEQKEILIIFTPHQRFSIHKNLSLTILLSHHHHHRWFRKEIERLEIE